jgi:uncharacterized protein YacL
MSIWVLRILFLGLCTLGGYAVSQVRPDLIGHGALGLLVGFGFGGLMIGIDEMLKGFSLRAFSAASFGLLLGSLIAWLVDNSGLFHKSDEDTRQLIRLGLFLGFGYVGMVLAMRSNKEDFTLIIPYIRFAPQGKAENLLLLDTSAILDGRVAGLIETGFLEGVVVVPRFVLKELQHLADSGDSTYRERGRRGLEVLSRLQKNPAVDVKIHEADIPEEPDVDGKLVRLARVTGARLYSNDFNLGKVAELQSVKHVNINSLAAQLKANVFPGEMLNLRIVREGREKAQGVGYLPDGTMVVVNEAQTLVGRQVDARVTSVVQTGAGKLIFADLKQPAAAA